jgi:hypothetical protein
MNDLHEQIMYKLGNVEGRMDVVEKKLDKIQLSIDELKEFQDRQKGEVTIIAIIWSVITAVGISIISYLLNKSDIL